MSGNLFTNTYLQGEQDKHSLIEYLNVHNLDRDITIRLKKKSVKLDGRVAMELWDLQVYSMA